MKIAIPSETDEGLKANVSFHFGRSPYFTIIDLENSEIKNIEIIKNPFSQNHGRPGQLPEFLKNLNVELIITGGMGQRAMSFFEQMGIKVISGVSGEIETVMKNLNLLK
ncbi:MAG: dinitrogenase iron-molybdenum cofactor [Candidatus Omnitrophota bacterium]|nr:MAG: dinitrogenase iron-molybdenum cofactor [Candidatus Omnitrophota bacterium]